MSRTWCISARWRRCPARSRFLGSEWLQPTAALCTLCLGFCGCAGGAAPLQETHSYWPVAASPETLELGSFDARTRPQMRGVVRIRNTSNVMQTAAPAQPSIATRATRCMSPAFVLPNSFYLSSLPSDVL